MNKYLKNIKYVFIHKWFVFLECLHFGIIWRGLVHDLSKFTPTEFGPYSTYFYGSGNNYKGFHIGGKNPEFDYAWIQHFHRNKHHWQFWAYVEDDGINGALEIPEQYVKEMVADWVGAGRVRGKSYDKNDRYKETSLWYLENKDKMILNLKTKALVEKIIGINETL